MMNLFRYFFQKNESGVTPERVIIARRERFNALYGMRPDRLVAAISDFGQGYLAPIERIIDEFETRDDSMRIGSIKSAAAVSRCPWTVQVKEGAEDAARAKLHRETLQRFWANIRVTDCFCQNRTGGLRLLVRQMMSAQSRAYAVHDIVWEPKRGGAIGATFTFVPAWFFEARTGRLRFLRRTGDWTGEPMPAGEWLVTAGDGVGIAASVLAMAKALSRNDWLLFSERCGMPGLVGNTTAAQGSKAWMAFEDALRSFGREWSALLDSESKITPLALNQGGTLPYPQLVDYASRAIAALYRGADLSTVSSQSAGAPGTGASVQGDESDLIEQDCCAMITETLREQVEPYVIRYALGDTEPLAGISIAPEQRQNVEQDIAIDRHLAGLGVRLSRKDALQRYGRSEADPEDPEDKPLELRPDAPAGFGGLGNEKATEETKGRKDERTEGLLRLVDAFAADLGPAAEKVRALLENLTPENAAEASRELMRLIPDDPEAAAILAEETAKAMAAGGGLENEFDENKHPRGKTGDGTPGSFAPGTGSREPKTPKTSDAFGTTDTGKLLADGGKANRERFASISTHLIGKKGGAEEHAFYRKDTGWIGIDYGQPGNPNNGYSGGHGLSHILAKHPGAVDGLGELLATGTCYRHAENENKLLLIKGQSVAVLSKSRDGRLLITEYLHVPNEELIRYTSKGIYHAKGEN